MTKSSQWRVLSEKRVSVPGRTVVSEGDRVVAITRTEIEVFPTEALGNDTADLIAAAPDLLDAALAALREYQMEGQLDASVRMLREALKKAGVK